MVGKLNVFRLYHHHKFTIGEGVLANGNQIIFKVEEGRRQLSESFKLSGSF